MNQRDRQDEAISAADACTYCKFGAVEFKDNPEVMTFWIEVFYKVYANIGRI